MMPEKIDSKDVRLDVVDFIVAGKCLDESKGCSGTNKYDGATCLQIFRCLPVLRCETSITTGFHCENGTCFNTKTV